MDEDDVASLQQEHQAELSCRKLFQRLSDSDEIFERFGHFEPLYLEPSRVEEVIHPLVIACGRASYVGLRVANLLVCGGTCSQPTRMWGYV